MSEVKSKRSLKKRAFTLVELLIVVIIIGILAGMVMLSAESAICSAKAARIIADLRSMKIAAIICKADNGIWPVWRYDEVERIYISPRGPGPGDYSDLKTMGDGYWVGAAETSGVAVSFVYLRDVSLSVKKCIEKQAEKSGLYGTNGSGRPSEIVLPMSAFIAENTMLWSIINK